MTATARIATDRLPGAAAGADRGGVPARRPSDRLPLRGSMFDETRIDIVRRGREQVAIAAGVTAGEKLATRRPDSGSDPEGLVKRRAFLWVGARPWSSAVVGTTLVTAVPPLPDRDF